MSILSEKLHQHSQRMLGYPINQNSKCAEAIRPYLDIVVNNIGDPFQRSFYGVNSFEVEREVIARLAALFHLRPSEAWGYVTSSGSEGNWRGLSLGVQGKPNCRVYCSKAAHYSAFQAIKMMRLEPILIKTHADHCIDVADFERKLDRNWPAVVCLTAGTTMSGAIDEIEKILRILKSTPVSHYVHVDAALSGFILPYLVNSPPFDFRLAIDSLSVSGHKMLGTPFASGAFISRKEHRPNHDIEYIGGNGATIFGSRNGLAPIALKHSLDNIDLLKEVNECVGKTLYLASRLEDIEWDNWYNDFSNTVMLRKPSQELIKKWQLATEGDWSHVIVMPHVSYQMISDFLIDLESELYDKTKT